MKNHKKQIIPISEDTDSDKLEKEKQERIFKIKHTDFCIISFPNGDIISICPEQLYNAIEEHIKNLVIKCADQSSPDKILSNRDNHS